MKNVIFIAPPSAGKGTQSSKFVSLGYEHISTGDMLRNEIDKETKLGLEIKNIINSGLLVNDDIVIKLITKKIENNNKPFILDGFPRTLNQAKMLDKLFADLKIDNYEVIYLDISLEESLKRALGRLTCKCGASYNTYYKSLAPKQEGICDKCGGLLAKREDDNEESFRKRYETFMNNTMPIVSFYKDKGKLHEISTELDVSEITKKIKEILK